MLQRDRSCDTRELRVVTSIVPTIVHLHAGVILIAQLIKPTIAKFCRALHVSLDIQPYFQKYKSR